MPEGSGPDRLSAAEPAAPLKLRSSAFLWAFGVSGETIESLSDASFAERLERADGWIWLHLPLSDQRARVLIEDLAALPVAAREMILSAETRVQVQFADSWAYGVLPDFERDLDGGAGAPGRLQFAVGERLLVTSRRRPLQCVDELRRSFLAGRAPAHPQAAWVELVELYAEAAEAWLHRCSETLDRIEDEMLRDDEDADQLALGPQRRELSRHHRDYLNLRSTLARAAAPRAPHRLDRITERLPRLAHAVEDLDRECRSLQDRARLLHEEMDTRIAAGANRSMRTLTIMSTLLIPPTLVVGAFGMNLSGIPFGSSHLGFAQALVLCLAIVGGACLLLRRWKIL